MKFDFLDGNKSTIIEMSLGETIEISTKNIKGVRVWDQSELLETHDVYFQALFRAKLRNGIKLFGHESADYIPRLDDRNLIGLRVLAVKR